MAAEVVPVATAPVAPVIEPAPAIVSFDMPPKKRGGSPTRLAGKRDHHPLTIASILLDDCPDLYTPETRYREGGAMTYYLNLFSPETDEAFARSNCNNL